MASLSRVLSRLPNELISIELKRANDSKKIMLETSSYIDDEGIERGRIGIIASTDLNQWPSNYTVEKKENLFSALLVGFRILIDTVLIIGSIGKMISGSISADNLGGPIQISVLAGSAAKAGYVTFLSMVAL